MIKGNVHDLLSLVADSESMGGYDDELSCLIEETMRMAEGEEIPDAAMIDVVAARKTQDEEGEDLFRGKRRK